MIYSLADLFEILITSSLAGFIMSATAMIIGITVHGILNIFKKI